mgnify:CR=1 FL=1
MLLSLVAGVPLGVTRRAGLTLRLSRSSVYLLDASVFASVGVVQFYEQGDACRLVRFTHPSSPMRVQLPLVPCVAVARSFQSVPQVAEP